MLHKDTKLTFFLNKDRQLSHLLLSNLLSGMLFFATACGQADPPYEPGPRPVQAMVVGEPKDVATRSFSGMARAAAEMAISFRVAGTLQELPVQIGQRVQAGDLMARLDATDYQLKVLELEAHVARARAAFIKAEADHERVRTLYANETVSKSELDQVRAALDSTRAELEAARKNLELVRQQLDYTGLHAPIAGTVSAVPVENFQNVQAGQPIVVLSTDEDLEFEVGLPDRLIHAVAPGQPVEVVFEVLPGIIFPARVSEMSIIPGAVSTYPVKLRLEQAHPRIRPGMIGEARFEIVSENGEHFVLAPPEAVFGLPDGRQAAWIVDPETRTVHRRTVTVGRLLNEGLQVLDGLEPGELLVVRGVHRLEEGQQVRLANGQPGQ